MTVLGCQGYKLLTRTRAIAPAVSELELSGNAIFGRKGGDLKNFFSVNRNQSTTILGRKYSGHAIDQMQNREIMPYIQEENRKYGVK